MKTFNQFISEAYPSGHKHKKIVGPLARMEPGQSMKFKHIEVKKDESGYHVNDGKETTHHKYALEAASRIRAAAGFKPKTKEKIF